MKRIRARSLLRTVGVDIQRPRRGLRSADILQAQRALMGTQKASLIVDVGAYKGETVAGYSGAFPTASVIAFEPFPPSVQRLRDRFSANKRVSIVPAALSDEVGRARFYVNRAEATNSLLPRPSTGRRYYPRGAGPRDEAEVPVTTLDHYRHEHGLGTIDILKLDVQGNEMRVLRGASRTLAEHAVRLLCCEVMFVPHYEGAAMFDELCEHLRPLGLTFFQLYDPITAKNGQLRFGDALFINDRLRAQVLDAAPAEP